MFKPVEPRPNFPKLEEEVLKFWEKNKIFEKSLQKNQGKEAFVFFEGPPTANGRPGLHHVEARSFKDLVLRFQTMRGRYVLRKAGWDTHGLPVELEVEKSMGISGKRQIENLVKGDKRASIMKFNKACKDSVWKYKDEWEQFTKKMGFWVDLDSPYITYEPNYIETVWWALKQIWERKVKNQPLIFQGHKVVPYCPRCGTPVSSHEVAQGYERVRENSLFVRFKLKTKQIELKDKKGHPEVIRLNKPAYLLSWTTTPWTLPGNVALAVGKRIEYAVVATSKEIYILAAELVDKVISEKYKILEKLPGDYLAGLAYEPLFEVPALKSDKSYKVYTADFVNIEEGTGIVHTAVMYGEEDYELGKAVGLPKFHTVNEEGKFIRELGELGGLFVKEEAAERLIINHLKKQKTFFHEEQYEHDYPFCWRCKSPLLYYARDSWFIRMSVLRKELEKNNAQINWVPAYIKEGRFGGWIKEAKDWAISRERYWGTPLPFWRCQSCKHVMCIGSVEELRSRAVRGEHAIKNHNSKLDLHRPFIDEVVLKCEACGKEASRTPEVLDVWFDSGAMPYAQWHYPFENEKLFKSQFPADFISEAIDQTRGWFYTLLAIATALGYDYPPYKNVINLGHVLDEKGQKMSKSKGNVVEPEHLRQKFGMDIVRWYFYTVNQPGDSKSFSEKDLVSLQRRLQMIYWNVLNYFVTYANSSEWTPDYLLQEDAREADTSAENVLDRWISVRLQELINEVSDNLSAFEIFRTARSIEEFITELSTWYVRRSRGRADRAFFATLYRVLLELSKLLAPFMPFLSEKIYQILRRKSDPESVHLTNWPVKKPINSGGRKILDNMKEVRAIVEAVLSWRKKNNLKVRQPLSDLLVKSDNIDLQQYSFLLAEELNFINIQINPDHFKVSDSFEVIPAQPGKHPEILVNKKITPELRLQGLARDLERMVQELRKNSGLKVGQQVDFYYETGSEEIYNAFEYFDQNKTYVARIVGTRQKVDFEREIKVGGQKVWIGLKKVNNNNHNH